MKILLFHTWDTNIGNEIIDKGAKTCLNKASPDSEIIEVSGLSNYTVMRSGMKFFTRYIGENNRLLKPLTRFAYNRIENAQEKSSFVNIGELLDADLAVLSGCILDIHLDWYAKTLKKMRDKGIPIILLGAGGMNYKTETQERVKKLITKINPKALITRDSMAYECYADLFENSYDGIDCGFFINDWYTPSKSSEKFIVLAFDKMKEPKIGTNFKVIRTHHEPIEPIFSGYMTAIGILSITRHRLKTFNLLKRPGFFVSDRVEDYLFLYSNAEEVHTDRVHATVSSLAYGTPVKFYSETTRSGLLNKVSKTEKLKENTVTINKSELKKKKMDQISYLENMLKSIKRD